MFSVRAQYITFIQNNIHGIYVVVSVPNDPNTSFVFTFISFVCVLELKLWVLHEFIFVFITYCCFVADYKLI